MKFVILGDTHFGMRNDSSKFHDYYEQFYTNIFFPYLEKHQINDIVQLGDLFDRRKYVNFNSLSRARAYFFDQCKDRGINLFTLLGNHDIFWKESLEVSSSDLLLRDYNNICVFDKPEKLTLGAVTMDMIPWICKENEDDVIPFIEQSKSDLCMGHFEIAGFSMYRGMEAYEGIGMNMFKNYHRVFSGHYHTQSKKGNVQYVGTPGEITWQDHKDPRGFHVFDDQTMDTTFVQNPYTMFEKIVYDDSDPLDVDKNQINPADYKDKFVKVVVVQKTDYYKFDVLINSLYNNGVHEVKIIEDFSDFEQGEVDEGIDLEDTLDVLSNYIDKLETDADKSKVKKFMRELYVEASNVEVV